MKKLTLIEAGQRILEADSIAITAHVSPDGDGIGSALGLCQYLKNNGKRAAVIFDDRLPAAFRFLKGYEKIVDISRRQEISPGEMTADLLVVLDTDLGRIGRVRDYVGRNIPAVNIDHHRTNDEQADYLFCDYRVSATAELIYDLIVGLDCQGVDQGYCRLPLYRYLHRYGLLPLFQYQTLHSSGSGGSGGGRGGAKRYFGNAGGPAHQPAAGPGRGSADNGAVFRRENRRAFPALRAGKGY